MKVFCARGAPASTPWCPRIPKTITKPSKLNTPLNHRFRWFSKLGEDSPNRVTFRKKAHGKDEVAAPELPGLEAGDAAGGSKLDLKVGTRGEGSKLDMGGLGTRHWGGRNSTEGSKLEVETRPSALSKLDLETRPLNSTSKLEAPLNSTSQLDPKLQDDFFWGGLLELGALCL